MPLFLVADKLHGAVETGGSGSLTLYEKVMLLRMEQERFRHKRKLAKVFWNLMPVSIK